MTYPTFASGDVLNASDMNAVGMWLVKTQTVGSGVSSVTVTGAFSADYDNYRIIYTGGSASTATGINLQLSGSTSTYSNALMYILYATSGTNTLVYNGTTSWVYAGSMDPNQNAFMDVDVFEPFVSRSTRFTQRWVQADSSGVNAGVHKTNASYTGFVITPQAGTITGGTIFVYGYNNG
jgi:hypothetical protein